MRDQSQLHGDNHLALPGNKTIRDQSQSHGDNHLALPGNKINERPVSVTW